MSDADATVGPLREAVAVALDEDLGVLGDLTSQAIIPEDALGTGHFVAREEGVLAGTQAVDEVYRQLDPDVAVTWRVQDGDPVAAGHELGRVFGPMRSILSGERTALVDAARARTESRGTHTRLDFPEPSSEFLGRFVFGAAAQRLFVPLPAQEPATR